MSDIRFNRWLHQSGTGGVYQASSGNVGVGTSVPSTTLDVNGSISATSFTATTGTITGNLSIGGVLSYEDVTNIDSVGIITARSDVSIADKIVHTGDTNTTIRFPAADTFTVETGGSERLRIASDGTVIVGTDTTVNPILRILGTSAHNSFIQFADGDSNNVGQLQYSHSSNALIVAVNGGEKLRITSDGKMGLGTQTPGDALSISGASAGLGIYNTGNNHGNVYFYKDGTAKGWLKYRGNDNKLVIGNVTDAINVLSSGWVGVNCTPFAQFHVKTGTNANISMSTMSSEASIEAYNDAGSANVPLRIRGTDIKFFSSSTERLRIDSAGRMGLGADNPGDYDGEANDFVVRSANHTGITIASSGSNQRCNLYFSDGTTSTQKYRGAITYDHNDDSLMVRTAAVERLRISSNGSATFDKGAPGGSNQVICRFQAESSRILDVVWHDSGSRMGFDTPGSHPYTFKIGGSEYLRLRSTHGAGNAFGPLLESVNGTGAFFDGGGSNKESDATVAITKQSNNDWGLMVRNYEGSSTDYGFYTRTKNTASYAIGVYDHDNSSWRFRVNGVGSIHATNTTLQSISDQRLKENIVDANSQWDDIKALRFRNFNWREDSGLSDGRTYLGLIAQEVEPISPNLVDINAQSKEDIENEVPDPEYKNVKYSIVWMKAVKALQEAQTRIETLETQLTDALARITALEG